MWNRVIQRLEGQLGSLSFNNAEGMAALMTLTRGTKMANSPSRRLSVYFSFITGEVKQETMRVCAFVSLKDFIVARLQETTTHPELRIKPCITALCVHVAQYVS